MQWIHVGLVLAATLHAEDTSCLHSQHCVQQSSRTGPQQGFNKKRVLRGEYSTCYLLLNIVKCVLARENVSYHD